MKNDSERKQAFKLALHHLWSRLLLFFAIFIVFIAIGLIIIRASTPLLATHHQDIQTWLEKRLNYPLQYGQLEAGWRGFEPIIELDNVTISNANNQALIHFDHFAIGFNLLHSLISRQLKIGLVLIQGTTLKIVDQGDGTTVIYGNTALPIATLKNDSQGNGNLIKYLFSINKIHLENIKVLWQKSTGQTIEFPSLMLEMLNKGNHHHAWGLAATSYPKISKLAFVANLKGNIMNKKTIKGEVYIHGRNLELKQWTPAFQFGNFSIDNGFLRGQTWTTISNGQIIDVQGEVTATKIQLANTKTKQKTNIDSLSSDLDWQRSADGWSISTDKILLNKNPKALPTEGLYFAYAGNPNNQPPKLTAFIQSASVDLLVKASNFLGYPMVAAKVKQYGFAANLKNLYVSFSNKQNFSASFLFNNAAIDVGSTALSHLQGGAYLFPNMGELELQSQHLQLSTDKVAEKTIVLTNQFLNQFYWSISKNTIKIKSPQFAVVNKDLSLQGKFSSNIPIKAPAATQVTADIKADSFDLSTLKQYLPSANKKHPHLLHFISNAFLAGTATAEININGALNQFPFSKNNGSFSATLQPTNLSLFYKNGWPSITQLTGTVNFNNQKMTASASKGMVLGTPITNITAVIPNIVDSVNPNITVQANSTATLENAMNFVSKTPLQNTLGKKLQSLNFQGPVSLVLDMNFSLKANNHQSDIQGNLTTPNATIQLPALGLEFDNVAGQLNFNNGVITATQLTGKFLQQAVTASIKTLNANTQKSMTQITMASRFLLSYLNSKIKNEFITKLSGDCDYIAQVQIFNKTTGSNSLTIKSNLLGVAIDLPKPFAKAKNTAEALNATVKFSNAPPVTVTATLGAKLSFQSLLQKDAGKVLFKNGNLHIGSGSAKPQISNGLLIDGYLPDFDWLVWKPLLTANSSNSNNMANYIRLVNITTKQLNFYSYLFPNTQVQAVYKNNIWNLTFNGKLIAGNMSLPNKVQPTLSANLTRLYLKTPKQVDGKTMTIAAALIPPLNVNIADFRRDTSRYGAVHLVTHPMQNGLTVNTVDIKSNNTNLTASGYWQQTKTSQLSSLQGTLAAANAQDLLSNSTYSNSFTAQNLQLKFNLQWSGSIFQPSLKTVSGTVNLQTGAGVINDIGSKADNEMATGQLLTILSLQSLQRRLTLNFNDLTNKGFSFDTIQGDFQLAKGLATTKNTAINGIVASINLNGNIDINQQMFDLYLQVTPKVTSSIPVIAALAGGPVIGAATWVVNKIFASSVNQIAAKYFHLSGSWSHPQVLPITSSTPEPQTQGKTSPFI